MKQNLLKFCMVLFITAIATNVFSQEVKKTDTLVVQTSAICGNCKYNIERALALEKGVKSAVLDLETKKVTVVYKPAKTNADKIRKAISNTGYDADEVPANPEAYKKLDPCCKKEFKGEHKD